MLSAASRGRPVGTQPAELTEQRQRFWGAPYLGIRAQAAYVPHGPSATRALYNGRRWTMPGSRKRGGRVLRLTREPDESHARPGRVVPFAGLRTRLMDEDPKLAWR